LSRNASEGSITVLKSPKIGTFESLHLPVSLSQDRPSEGIVGNSEIDPIGLRHMSSSGSSKDRRSEKLHQTQTEPGGRLPSWLRLV